MCNSFYIVTEMVKELFWGWGVALNTQIFGVQS